MHGGPIVAVLGAVDNVVGFFIAMLIGILIDAALILVLVGWSQRSRSESPKVAEAGATGAPAATSLISPTTVSLDSAADTTRDEVIRELVAQAATEGRVNDPEALISAALAREEQHSTGVGYGVAIPHARSSAIAVPTLAFARLPQPGVQWADNEDPTDLAFLIAVPEASGKQHLKLLSQLARHLMKDDFRAQLRTAATSEEVVKLIDGVVS